ncbi:hypothetical protein PCE1_003459 [Barthelona sp. PCE]
MFSDGNPQIEEADTVVLATPCVCSLNLFLADITINKKKSVEPCKKLDVIGFTIIYLGSPDDPNMKQKATCSAITINAIIHEALKDKDGIPRKITKWFMTRSLTIGDQDLKEVQHHEHGQIEAQPKATDPTSGSPLIHRYKRGTPPCLYLLRV